MRNGRREEIYAPTGAQCKRPPSAARKTNAVFRPHPAARVVFGGGRRGKSPLCRPRPPRVFRDISGGRKRGKGEHEGEGGERGGKGEGGRHARPVYPFFRTKKTPHDAGSVVSDVFIFRA